MLPIVLLTLTIATLFLAQAVYWIVRFAGDRKQEELRRRLRHVGEDQKEEHRLLRKNRLAKSRAIDRLLRSFGGFERLSKLLTQTDLEWTVAEVLAYSAALAAIGGVLGLIVRTPLLSPLLMLLGGALPALALFHSRSKRSHGISRQLPEALDMLGRSLRSGHALPTAIKLAAQELPTPIATELGRCYEEQALGTTVDRAIMNMTERVPSNLDLKIFAVSVVVQQQVGGNVAEILERISETIRKRYEFYGHLRGLTAEGRLSGWILGSVPWIVLGAIWVIRREYLVEFFIHPVGKTMALGALMLWGLGILWMKRIIKVEV